MASTIPPEVEEKLAPMREAVRQKADQVRKLKEGGAPEADWKQALHELKNLKKALEDKQLELAPPAAAASFDRSKLEDLLKQRFFYQQAFTIYGGVQGLYDFGPTGCAVKAHLLAAWRQFFINEEHMLEIEGTMLTPEPVLKASGHVDRFADWMVKDTKTGECFRADHLLEAGLERLLADKNTSEEQKQEITRLMPTIDNMKAPELQANIVKYGLHSPTTGNDLTEPQQFNLMFSTSIGPAGAIKGYLRPETAQGIFVNFRKLLEFNQDRMPFAAAQIGYSFRNEISPRSGIIRVREFCMAEIEHFLDPLDKSHTKFHKVADYRMMLYSACVQMNGESAQEWRVGDAVSQKLIANETLGYYLARVHQFLVKVGMDPTRVRFRQHLANEMSHYATDCWDAECLTSYGWVEVVGCADRSCYDLTQHSKTTGSRLMAERKLPEPKVINTLECVPNKPAIGRAYKQQGKLIMDHLAALNEARDEASIRAISDSLASGMASLTIGDSTFQLSKEHLDFKQVERKVHVEHYTPNVIEPSFGIGRIMYGVFEHNFRIREGDAQRTYLSLPAVIAPFKCSVLPLSNNTAFEPYVRRVSDLLATRGVSHRVDDSSGSIGRRYARTDQIAIPFGITIDFDTTNQAGERFETVTLRERDSLRQVRGTIEQVVTAVADLCSERTTWAQVEQQLPAFVQQESTQD